MPGPTSWRLPSSKTRSSKPRCAGPRKSVTSQKTRSEFKPVVATSSSECSDDRLNSPSTYRYATRKGSQRPASSRRSAVSATPRQCDSGNDHRAIQGGGEPSARPQAQRRSRRDRDSDLGKLVHQSAAAQADRIHSPVELEEVYNRDQESLARVAGLTQRSLRRTRGDSNATSLYSCYQNLLLLAGVACRGLK
jgi:hypothetical protein